MKSFWLNELELKLKTACIDSVRWLLFALMMSINNEKEWTEQGKKNTKGEIKNFHQAESSA